MTVISQNHKDEGILRIRPGPLANFSGGAGYMPFIIIFSVPASFVFEIVGSLILHSKWKAALSGDSESDETLHKAALNEFILYAYRHLNSCVLISVIIGIVLFFMGISQVYDFKAVHIFHALVYSFGPFIAWVMSTFLLIQQIYEHGDRFFNLVFAGVIYILTMIAWFFILTLFV